MKVPAYYVFIDVDETLIKFKSMFSFLEFLALENKLIKRRYNLFKIKLKFARPFNIKREKINRMYYKLFHNLEESCIFEYGQKWFRQLDLYKIFNHNVLQEINMHRKLNAEVVLISGSLLPCLQPIAIYLGLTTILCTKQEINKSGKYTGKLIDYPIIGYGKAMAVQKFLKNNCFAALDNCYAYADDISDLPLLKLIGHPIVVPLHKSLLNIAKQNHWGILHQENK